MHIRHSNTDGYFADPATRHLMAALFGEPESGGWRDEAACAQVDPDAFFPERGGSLHDAKAVCHRCPVRAECLDDALARDEPHGIWGGLSERERRKLRTQAAV